MKPSKIRYYFALSSVLQKKPEYYDLINLSIGAPDIRIPRRIYEKAALQNHINYWKAGRKLGYGAIPGSSRLLELITIRHMLESKTLLQKEKDLIVETAEAHGFKKSEKFYENILASEHPSNFTRKFLRRKKLFNCLLDLANHSDYYNPNRTIITHGVTQALHLTTLYFKNKTDFLLLEPNFLLYGRTPDLSGVERNYKYVPCSPPNFYPNLDKLESTASKGDILIVNSPCNPTGAVYPEDVVTDIAKIARRKKLIVLSDEIYDLFSFDQSFTSFYEMLPEQTMLFNGFSKVAGMPDLRVGYVITSKQFESKFFKDLGMKAAFSNFKAGLTVNQSGASQEQPIQFLNEYLFERLYATWVSKYLQRYKSARDILRAGLVELKMYKGGFDGAFYGMAYIKDLFDEYPQTIGRMFNKTMRANKDMNNFLEINLKHKKTDIPSCTFYDKAGQLSNSDIFSYLSVFKTHCVVVPGAEFGTTGEDYVRLAYPANEKVIQDFLKRWKLLISEIKG